jgi:ABC-2 type transport system permease protein
LEKISREPGRGQDGIVKNILFMRYRILANSLKAAGPGQLSKALVILSLAAGFVWADYFFFHKVIGYIAALEMVGPILLVQFLNLLFLSFLSLLVYSNIINTLSTAYMASDMGLLTASPLGPRWVFLYKSLLTIFESSYMVVIFGTPIFIVLGRTYHLGPVEMFGLLGIFLAFLLVPAQAGIAVTMFLMTFLPARKTHRVLTALGLVLVGTAILFIRLLRPERLLTDMDDDLVVQFLDSLKVADRPYLPSSMITRGVMALLEGRSEDYRLYLLLLVSTAVLMAVAVLALAGPFYTRGLSRAGVTGGERRLPGRKPGRTALAAKGSLPHLVHILKDARIFTRDASQWSQMLLLLALIVLYLFNVKAIGADNLYMKNFISFLNIGLAGFVLSAIGARFIFSSVSLEGGAFWIIRSSPEKKWIYLTAKFLIHFVPLFLLGEVLIIASNIILSADSYMMVLSSATILCICVGLVGLGIGLGALFPRFRFVSTAQIATSWGGVLYMIISLLYVGAVVTLEARPVWRHFWKLLTGRSGAVWDIRMAYLAVVLLTVLVALVPLILAGRRLEEMGL